MNAMSKCFAATGAGLVLILALAVFPGTVAADDWNLMTSFSTNIRTEVPGAVLEPNTTYVMQLLDNQMDRRVVEVWNEDQTRLITTFMAIPDFRLDPTYTTQFEFMESRAGHPVPIKTWFYPSHQVGLDFVYSKEQAAKIATYTQGTIRTEQVASLKTDVSVPTAAVAPPEELKVVAPEAPPAIAAAEPEDEPALVAQNDSTASTPIIQNTELPRELPRTAGDTPLIGLLGAASLALSLGLRFAMRLS